MKSQFDEGGNRRSHVISRVFGDAWSLPFPVGPSRGITTNSFRFLLTWRLTVAPFSQSSMVHAQTVLCGADNAFLGINHACPCSEPYLSPWEIRFCACWMTSWCGVAFHLRRKNTKQQNNDKSLSLERRDIVGKINYKKGKGSILIHISFGTNTKT